MSQRDSTGSSKASHSSRCAPPSRPRSHRAAEVMRAVGITPKRRHRRAPAPVTMPALKPRRSSSAEFLVNSPSSTCRTSSVCRRRSGTSTASSSSSGDSHVFRRDKMGGVGFAAATRHDGLRRAGRPLHLVLHVDQVDLAGLEGGEPTSIMAGPAVPMLDPASRSPRHQRQRLAGNPTKQVPRQSPPKAARSAREQGEQRARSSPVASAGARRRPFRLPRRTAPTGTHRTLGELEQAVPSQRVHACPTSPPAPCSRRTSPRSAGPGSALIPARRPSPEVRSISSSRRRRRLRPANTSSRCSTTAQVGQFVEFSRVGPPSPLARVRRLRPGAQLGSKLVRSRTTRTSTHSSPFVWAAGSGVTPSEDHRS